MTKFFLSLYRFFRQHKALYYIIMIGSAVIFALAASKIRLEENIISLLPKTDHSKECDIAFSDIKVKDKVFIELLPRQGYEMTPAQMCEAMGEFVGILQQEDSTGRFIDNILQRFDTDDAMNILYYAMEALPCHLPEEIYGALDTLLCEETIDAYASGQASLPTASMGYGMQDGCLMAPDKSFALAFLSPAFNSYETLVGNQFETFLSTNISKFCSKRPECEILYHGMMVESTFNSRQIKKDLIWTIGISLLLICFLICLCMKSKGTLLHLVCPIVYGILFSMAVIYWTKGAMSLMALGIGAIVMGVALSYCLHVLVHHKFVPDVETVIAEQTRPVCLGCLTTIGAFAGLLLTSSDLLRDFGIFASLALVGTTFFALAFLPQMFSTEGSPKNEKAFNIINKINSYSLHRNKVVVGLLAAISIFCLFKAKDVKFDNDLANIGYREPKMVRSEQLYNAAINSSCACQYYASLADDLDSAIALSQSMAVILDSLQKDSLVHSYSSTGNILVSEGRQMENIARWKAYWTPSRVQKTYRLLQKESEKYSWDTTGFDIPETFLAMVQSDYVPTSLYDSQALPAALTSNFVEHSDRGWMVFTSVLLDRSDMKAVNDAIACNEGMIVLEPFYYTGDMVQIARDDFNVVLLVSSIFVFIVLLLSFRSLAISLIAFLPMFLSWYIVQGIMAVFGLQFNLINIMISTFIFGIGVDYSIFVMDGLIAKARSKSSRLLICHKAAIFFSALTLIIVTGSLVFATHPAISSVGICTIIGMSATILITYAFQPLLFKLAIKNERIRRIALKEKKTK